MITRGNDVALANPVRSARLGRYRLLRVAVVLALLAGFALSPKLWLSSRIYPLTPVWSFFGTFSHPADRILFFAVITLLIAFAVAPRRELSAAMFALLVLLALQDQSRWQPWFYQYVLMLLAIALAGARGQTVALNTCSLIVATTYIWSGISKLNPHFMSYTFPWLMGPFIGHWPAAFQRLILHLALVVPCLECATGAGLLLRRFRPAALVAAIAFHIFVLIAIGPLGRNFNVVVWPWNLFMMAFLCLLFLRRTDAPALRDLIWARGFGFQKIVVVIFALMPILSFFDLWDDYLSSALYSGNPSFGMIYLNNDAFSRLPAAIYDYFGTEGPDLNGMNINDWSIGELNVPAYPEIRIYKSVAQQICKFTLNDSSVELAVRGKSALLNGGRLSVYHCADFLAKP